MEPADQVPRPRNRPIHNSNDELVLSNINFVMTNNVNLINDDFDTIGQQFVRMRDIRWRDARLPRGGFFSINFSRYESLGFVHSANKWRLCFSLLPFNHHCLKRRKISESLPSADKNWLRQIVGVDAKRRRSPFNRGVVSLITRLTRVHSRYGEKVVQNFESGALSLSLNENFVHTNLRDFKFIKQKQKKKNRKITWN